MHRPELSGIRHGPEGTSNLLGYFAPVARAGSHGSRGGGNISRHLWVAGRTKYYAGMKLHSKLIRAVVTRLARAYGFLDPVAVLARLRGFFQASEVSEPIELLRAGMLFHAR